MTDDDCTPPSRELAPRGADLVFYDGVCPLCNGAVRFLLKRDDRRRFRYAALESEVAGEILRPLGIDPEALDAMVLVEGWGERDTVREGPAAVLRSLELLGGGWKIVRPLRRLPGLLLQPLYRLVAKTRYAIFGRYESCPLAEPEHRELFLDQSDGVSPQT